jgi:hypothetical protein
MTHWLEKVVLLFKAPTSDLRALAELVGEDPKTFYRGIDLDGLEVEGQDLTGMEFGDIEADGVANDNNPPDPYKIAVSISRISRQEERVSVILDLILRDRRRGFEILNKYQGDRAKFASYAIEEIRSSFSDESSTNDQIIAASLVARFFSYTYPMNRGRLLFFLATHLAKYPVVNAAISRCLSRTASMFVEEYRSKIRALLDSGV